MLLMIQAIRIITIKHTINMSIKQKTIRIGKKEREVEVIIITKRVKETKNTRIEIIVKKGIIMITSQEIKIILEKNIRDKIVRKILKQRVTIKFS